MGTHCQIRLMTPEEVRRVRKRKLFHLRAPVTDPCIRILRDTMVETGYGVERAANDLGLAGSVNTLTARLNEAYGHGWREREKG